MSKAEQLPTPDSQKNQTKKIMKWALNIIVPLIFFLIPTTADYTQEIKLFLVITSFTIILIATEHIPVYASVIFLPVAYAIFLELPNSVVYSAWTESVAWISMGGMVLTMALTKTGLLRRLAYRVILACGGNFTGILVGMFLVGALVSTVMTDLAAKAILFSALGVGVCQALNFEMKSREASAIGLATLACCLGPSYFFYTGSGANVVSLAIVERVLPGSTPSWTGYVTQMALPQLIYVILTLAVVFVFFRPKEKIESSDFLRSTLKEMGPMSGSEIRTAILGVLLIVMVATTDKHGIAASHLFVLAATIFFCPFMKVLTGEDVKKINFGAVYFVVGCQTIGVVSSNLGVGTFIANLVYPYIAGSTLTTFIGTWFLGFFANFGLTPSAAWNVFTEPLTQICIQAGINPLPLIYTFINSLEQVLLPYEYVPVLLIYGTGMISMGSFVKYNLIRAGVAFACILCVFMPYWKMIGLL